MERKRVLNVSGWPDGSEEVARIKRQEQVHKDLLLVVPALLDKIRKKFAQDAAKKRESQGRLEAWFITTPRAVLSGIDKDDKKKK